MVYLAITLMLVLFLVFKSRSSRKREDDMELLFNTELQKIKSDSVLNFIDTDFIDKNFEFFGVPRYFSAANDTEGVSYHITSLQDLTPQDLA